MPVLAMMLTQVDYIQIFQNSNLKLRVLSDQCFYKCYSILIFIILYPSNLTYGILLPCLSQLVQKKIFLILLHCNIVFGLVSIRSYLRYSPLFKALTGFCKHQLLGLLYNRCTLKLKLSPNNQQFLHITILADLFEYLACAAGAQSDGEVSSKADVDSDRGYTSDSELYGNNSPPGLVTSSSVDTNWIMVG